MTKAEFEKYTGEDPEDVLGPDWENLIEEYVESLEGNEHFHDGHQLGGCYQCKAD